MKGKNAEKSKKYKAAEVLPVEANMSKQLSLERFVSRLLEYV